jgi:hypothetical protein
MVGMSNIFVSSLSWNCLTGCMNKNGRKEMCRSQMNRNLVGSIYMYGRFCIKRNKNCLWWPCLLTDQDTISHLYRKPSIDDSYQVSIHLAEWCQRRRFFKISINQKQELPVVNLVGSISGSTSMLISPPCINKHGHHRQFLFLIGCFLKKNLLLWNRLDKWTETW